MLSVGLGSCGEARGAHSDEAVMTGSSLGIRNWKPIARVLTRDSRWRNTEKARMPVRGPAKSSVALPMLLATGLLGPSKPIWFTPTAERVRVVTPSGSASATEEVMKKDRVSVRFAVSRLATWEPSEESPRTATVSIEIAPG